MSVAAVVLAAGASRRLGSPKQLAMLSDETLLGRAVRVAREAGCSPVIVVLGAEAELVSRGLPEDVLPVMNEQWREGMGASIRAGVGACEGAAEGVLVMTCDQPAVTIGHLRLLMAGREIKASRYAARKGVPAFFPQRYFEELMTLKGDVGARELLASAEFVDLESGELDVDTVEDLARAREMFR
ncbi:nucleotidyltransferase family protein [Edaphobacter paludis]|uniref:Nucleotidyltransferase family protein n=1 Tax=Edaphobacter paludis TaxID=3035702 RepID=A0AAU7D016_9BACT